VIEEPKGHRGTASVVGARSSDCEFVGADHLPEQYGHAGKIAVAIAIRLLTIALRHEC
jgi:hypothetical protein